MNNFVTIKGNWNTKLTWTIIAVLSLYGTKWLRFRLQSASFEVDINRFDDEPEVDCELHKNNQLNSHGIETFKQGHANYFITQLIFLIWLDAQSAWIFFELMYRAKVLSNVLEKLLSLETSYAWQWKVT